MNILVVVDSIFRLTAGGDIEPRSGGADRFMATDLATKLLSKTEGRHERKRRQAQLREAGHKREARSRSETV